MKKSLLMLMLVIAFQSLSGTVGANPKDNMYTVSVKSANDTKGTVYIYDSADPNNKSLTSVDVKEGDEVTFVAQAKTGYRFAYWNDESQDAVHQVTVEGNRKYIAYFANNINSGDYTEIGTTDLYSKSTSSSIDIKGLYNGTLYRSTYNDGGYIAAMKVNNNAAARMDCQSGGTYYGVRFVPSVVPQGNLARMVYTVTNTNTSSVTVSLGTHADVMIGSNDRAPITRRIDLNGNTYGLTMRDNSEAQLCVLFGAGLSGVTPISGFWFGYYSLNRDPSNMVGNYSSGSNYMVENGSYDSGMGWCWKNVTLDPGATREFAVLIGVGEVNLTPYSDLTVTPVNSEDWNDLTALHTFIVSGTYNSPAGLSGVLEYAVETSDEWFPLTEVLNDGDGFSNEITILFDETLYDQHTIRLRTRDNVGNTSNLPSVEYDDIRKYNLTGINNYTYTGSEIYQDETQLGVELEEEQYSIANYRNNINAGTAQFDMEGVYPFTIGRKMYEFEILPQPLTGTLHTQKSYFVFDNGCHISDCYFSDYDNLVVTVDYDTVWTNNRYPGVATLTVTGKNNYTGTLTAEIVIDKAPFSDANLAVSLTEHFIIYDGEVHQAAVESYPAGIGNVIFTYLYRPFFETDWVEAEHPIEEGEYIEYMTVTEGAWYYGVEKEEINQFTILRFDLSEWEILQQIYADLTERDWTKPWDLSKGMTSVAYMDDITIENGHIVSMRLNDNGLTGSFPVSVLNLPYLKELTLDNNRLSGNVEEALTAWTEQGATSVHGLTYLDISHNQLEGNLGAVAALFPQLQTLKADYNRFAHLSPAVPTDVTLSYEYQNIRQSYTLFIENPVYWETLRNTLPEIAFYDQNGGSYTLADDWTVTGRAIPERAIPQWSEKLVSDFNGGYTWSHEQTHAYRYSTDDTLWLESETHHITIPVRFTFLSGDVNFTGENDINDLQGMINYILETYNYNVAPFNYSAADMNQDAAVNVLDVVSLVDELLPSYDEPDYVMPRNKAAQTEDSGTRLWWRNGELHLYSDCGIAALDIVTESQSAVEWLVSGYTLSQKTENGRTHAIVYSLQGKSFAPSEEHIIARCSDTGIRTVRAAMSDTEARPVRVSLDTQNQTPTALPQTTVPVRYILYDLAGRKIAEGSLTGGDTDGSSITGLATGAYIISLRDINNKQVAERIIVK